MLYGRRYVGVLLHPQIKPRCLALDDLECGDSPLDPVPHRGGRVELAGLDPVQHGPQVLGKGRDMDAWKRFRHLAIFPTAKL